MEFCEVMREKIDSDEQFLKNILFTDESTFFLNGPHNAQNVRYWSRENKHLSLPLRTQYPQKLNVWVGILGDNIFVPFFINGTLNCLRYLQLLQEEIISAVRGLNVNLDEIWFHQNGWPAHNGRHVQEFLETMVPGPIIAVVHVFNEKETLISRGTTVLGSGHAKDMFLSSQLYSYKRQCMKVCIYKVELKLDVDETLAVCDSVTTEICFKSEGAFSVADAIPDVNIEELKEKFSIYKSTVGFYWLLTDYPKEVICTLDGMKTIRWDKYDKDK